MQTGQIIKARRTSKVLGNVNSPAARSRHSRAEITSLVAAAGNAPFHYPCAVHHQEKLASPVPWRAYTLDTSTCKSLMQKLIESGDVTKVPNMLAAAEFLVQLTWLPDADTILDATAMKEEPMFSGTQRNMEHVAAASAFAQSLLLLATDAGFRTYWSSGGPLRSEEVFDLLDISHSEILLGSIFLYPQDVGKADMMPGKLAGKRGDVTEWSRWCEIF